MVRLGKVKNLPHFIRCISFTQFKLSTILHHIFFSHLTYFFLISSTIINSPCGVIKNSMCQTQLQNTQHCMGWRLYPLLIIPIALPQKTMIICIDFDEMI